MKKSDRQKKTRIVGVRFDEKTYEALEKKVEDAPDEIKIGPYIRNVINQHLLRGRKP